LRRFSRGGGPAGSYRWIVAHPRRTAWWVFTAELVAIGALLVIWQPEPVSVLVVDLGFLVLGAGISAGLVAQIMYGERRVYEEWLGQSDPPP
jgi:hypothetical protein